MTRRQAVLGSLLMVGATPVFTQEKGSTTLRAFGGPLGLLVSLRDELEGSTGILGGIGWLEVEYQGKRKRWSAKEIWEALQ